MKQATRPPDFVATEVPEVAAQRSLMRLWTIAFATAGTFVLVLVGLVLISPGESALPEASSAPRATSGPRTSPCIACQLGHECGASGQCVLIERGPVECVRGAVYDEVQEYCVPEDTPLPVRTVNPARRARSSGGTAPTPAGSALPPVQTPIPTPGSGGTTPAPSTPAPTPAQ